MIFTDYLNNQLNESKESRALMAKMHLVYLGNGIYSNKQNKKFVYNNKSKKFDEVKQQVKTNKSGDINKTIEYLSNITENQRDYLIRLFAHVSQSDVKYFDPEEVEFLINIPGLPDRTGEMVYRSIALKKDDSTFKEIYNLNKETEYKNKEKEFSSWTLNYEYAFNFLKKGEMFSTDLDKFKYEVIFESKITKNSLYIDTYHILNALGHIDKYKDYAAVTYAKENEIVYLGEDFKCKIISYTNIEEN